MFIDRKEDGEGIECCLVNSHEGACAEHEKKQQARKII